MDASVFESRRARAREVMGEGVLVVFSAPEFIRNGDVEHEYRQDSNFQYLTGLDEPECALVLTTGENPTFTLFVRERNKEREIWDGPRAGLEGAKQRYGADAAYPIGELAQRLPELLLGHGKLYYRFGVHGVQDERLIDALRRCHSLRRRKRYPTELIDSARVLHALRFRKTPEEVEAMRQAIRITGEAHLAAMRACAPGRFEYELEAELRYVFCKGGSHRAAYTPIVGSGPNATILHYIQNDRRIEAGDLVLIDAGCEFDYQAADVTRTFPASGKFSEPQRRLYELVLGAQQAAFATIAPGASLDEMHSASLRHITLGLIELGFIEGPFEMALSDKRFQRYFMHGTGHYLGMDVHDVAPPPADGKAQKFEPGVVITVEPGIYVAPDDDSVPAEYRGIGIRIEDDVMVTESGYENLTAAIPRSVSEIEALMSQD